MSDESVYERLDKIQRDLGETVEDLGAAIFHAVESETLKRIALDHGIDHTREGTFVLEQIAHQLQAKADVIRELRRQVNAQANTIDHLRADVARLTPPTIQPDPEPVPGGLTVRVDEAWFRWAMGRL